MSRQATIRINILDWLVTPPGVIRGPINKIRALRGPLPFRTLLEEAVSSFSELISLMCSRCIVQRVAVHLSGGNFAPSGGPSKLAPSGRCQRRC